MKNLMKDWYVSYDPYTDLLQLYNDEIIGTLNNDVIQKNVNGVRLIYSTKSSYPVLFEIDNVYRRLKKDIEKMPKDDIIDLVLTKANLNNE